MRLEIVAEIGGNHMGSLDLAMKLVDEAAASGATAVKFQAFDPEDLSPDHVAPHYQMRGGAWHARYLHDLYTETRTPWDWLPALFKHARKSGLHPFASVFAPKNVERLIDMGSTWLKIASPEVTYRELVTKIGTTKHPVIMSDGACTLSQLIWALGELLQNRTTVLRCVSKYPADASSYGFRDIGGGGMAWGVSDHSLEATVPVTAVAMGASMVEAHLMLDPAKYGRPVDIGHSLIPQDFEAMAQACRVAEALRMSTGHTYHDRTNNTVDFRRRLVWARDLKAYDTVRGRDIAVMRSNCGKEPEDRQEIIGRKVTQDVKRWDPIYAEQF